jgi:hypothetical protein
VAGGAGTDGAGTGGAGANGGGAPSGDVQHGKGHHYGWTNRSALGGWHGTKRGDGMARHEAAPARRGERRVGDPEGREAREEREGQARLDG